MIIACHRLGKTTETIVKFANRKDAELILKSKKKKLKDINLLEVCTALMEIVGFYLMKQIVILRMLMSVTKTREEKYIYIYIKVFAPIIGSFTFRLRNDIMKDSFTTSG